MLEVFTIYTVFIIESEYSEILCRILQHGNILEPINIFQLFNIKTQQMQITEYQIVILLIEVVYSMDNIYKLLFDLILHIFIIWRIRTIYWFFKIALEYHSPSN